MYDTKRQKNSKLWLYYQKETIFMILKFGNLQILLFRFEKEKHINSTISRIANRKIIIKS